MNCIRCDQGFPCVYHEYSLDSSEEDSSSLNKKIQEQAITLKRRSEVTSDEKQRRDLRRRRWLPGNWSIEQAFEKMLKNSQKAISEHSKKEFPNDFPSLHSNFFKEPIKCPTLEQILQLPARHKPLQCTHMVSTRKGKRETMEDSDFYLHEDRGALAGVLDGHGGKEVAEIAKIGFMQYFFKSLTAAKGNVYQAFENVFECIQNDIRKNPELNRQGCVAAVCFIDFFKGLIYTATLGDSEAFVFTKDPSNQLIPLSCVRDWSSKKDRDRVSHDLNNLHRSQFNKDRYKYLNVSRALGDLSLEGTEERAAITHKPKISVHLLPSKSTVLIACDGLVDFVSPREIINAMASPNVYQDLETLEKEPFERPRSVNLAEKLANYAIDKRGSTDNVSVIIIEVSE